MSPQERSFMLKTDAVISVVDDDESVRNSLKRLLRSMGFEVRVFPSARDFLNQGPLYDHGCAIVDVRMPEMDGLALQKRLFDSGVSLPVIFITAYEDPGVRAQAIQAGALAFLQKPFSDPSLLDAINLALERSKEQIPGNSATVREGGQAYIQSGFKMKTGYLNPLERKSSREEKGSSKSTHGEERTDENFTATYWG